jgi:hypothetical protein
MRKKLHPIVLIVGIAQVVFGLSGFCCGGYYGISGAYIMTNPQFNAKKTPSAYADKLADNGTGGAYMLPMEQDDVQVELIRRIPSYGIAQSLDALTRLLFALLMIASGIGLFFMQSWARWLAIGYAVLSILASLLGALYSLIFILAPLLELNDELGAQGDPYLATLGASFTVWTGAYVIVELALIVYPIAVLIMLLIPPVNRAFRGEPVPVDAAKDHLRENVYHDDYPRFRDDDDRPWRRY